MYPQYADYNNIAIAEKLENKMRLRQLPVCLHPIHNDFWTQ